MSSCKQVVRQAVREARRQGLITVWQSIQAQTALSRLRGEQEELLEQFIYDEAVVAGQLAYGDGLAEVDWDKLAEFIKTILTAVLEFLQGLFQILPQSQPK